MLYKKTKQPFDIVDALSYHDAKFGEVRTNGADKAAALVNQQVARPVQHQNSLLIRRVPARFVLELSLARSPTGRGYCIMRRRQ